MLRLLIILGIALGLAGQAQAFCGFYVGRATADLFNEASKVVYAREGSTSVITMVSDYQGSLSDFAMVVPVPVILEEDDVRLASAAAIEHLDAFTSPRLVEYTDPNPCQQQKVLRSQALTFSGAVEFEMAFAPPPPDLQVTIERSYSVGEYDILILSAQEADGLITWLNQEGYKIPPKALPVVKEYLAKGMKFFVAKINLTEASNGEKITLNPLQMRFESENFMLPLRLGMANAKPGQEQDLIAYFLTKQHQVETLSYPLAKIPTDQDLPTKIEPKFQEFYKAAFAKANQSRFTPSAFLEYAWDMNWCDPCAADPLSQDELLDLGAFWLEPNSPFTKEELRVLETFPVEERALIIQTILAARGQAISPRPGGQARQAFVTRIHMRYSEQTHTQDLSLAVTNKSQNFQGRYILRHAATLSDEQKTQQCGMAYTASRRAYELGTQGNLEALTGRRLEEF